MPALVARGWALATAACGGLGPAAKAGIRVIDVSQIDGDIKKVMDQCAAAPNMTVPQAFRQALGGRR